MQAEAQDRFKEGIPLEAVREIYAGLLTSQHMPKVIIRQMFAGNDVEETSKYL